MKTSARSPPKSPTWSTRWAGWLSDRKLLKHHARRMDWLVKAKDTVVTLCVWVLQLVNPSEKQRSTSYPSLSVSTYKALIAESPDPGEVEQAESSIEAMLKDGVIVEVTYNALISCYVRLGKFDKVEKWMLKISSAGFHVDVENFNATLSCCCKKGQVMRSASWLEKSRKMGITPNEDSYCIVIEGLSKQTIMWLAEEWTQRLQKSGLPLTGKVYLALIIGYVRKGDLFKVHYWFSLMRKDGVDATLRCYDQVVKLYINANNLIYAEEVLEDMLSNMHATTSATQESRYVALFDGFLLACLAKAKDFDTVDDWLRKMKNLNLFPGLSTYCSFVVAAGKEQDWTRVEKYAEESGIQHSLVNAKCLTKALEAYANAGETQHACRWFDKIESCGAIEMQTYNSMINAHAKAGDVDGAVEWLEKLHTHPEFKIDAVPYSLVMHACANTGNIDMILKIFHMMKREGIHPSLRCFNNGLDACAKVGNQQLAEVLMSQMNVAGHSAESTTYNTMINVCAKAGDANAAERWLKTMQESNLKDNVQSYTSVIDAYARLGDRENAKRLFYEMIEKGFKPTIVSYASLARPFARSGDWKFVEFLQQDLQKQGLQINEFFLAELLLAYGKAEEAQCERALESFRSAVSFPSLVKPDRVCVLALRSCVGPEAADQCIKELGVSVKSSPARKWPYEHTSWPPKVVPGTNSSVKNFSADQVPVPGPVVDTDDPAALRGRLSSSSEPGHSRNEDPGSYDWKRGSSSSEPGRGSTSSEPGQSGKEDVLWSRNPVSQSAPRQKPKSNGKEDRPWHNRNSDAWQESRPRSKEDSGWCDWKSESWHESKPGSKEDLGWYDWKSDSRMASRKNKGQIGLTQSDTRHKAGVKATNE